MPHKQRLSEMIHFKATSTYRTESALPCHPNGEDLHFQTCTTSSYLSTGLLYRLLAVIPSELRLMCDRICVILTCTTFAYDSGQWSTTVGALQHFVFLETKFEILLLIPRPLIGGMQDKQDGWYLLSTSDIGAVQWQYIIFVVQLEDFVHPHFRLTSFESTDNM